MKKNKICCKRSLKGLAFILLVLLSCVYISSAAEISEKRLLTNLKENVSNEDEIDKLLLNKVCANIQVHLDKGKAIDAEEYYYLAYKNKIDNDEFNYKNNMLSAYRLINDKTDTFAKLSINVSIIQGFDDEVSIEEQSIVYKDTLGSLTAKEINDNASLIQKYISIMSSKIEDENIQTEVLSNIYSKSAALDSGFAYYVRDTLTIEYAHKGNYAKSIELILKSFWQNEVDPSPFYEARALINTGLIYCELNDYDAAIEYLKKSMNIKIEDKSLDDHTKLYALINLYLIYYDKDDYDSMFNALNLIKEYAGDEIIKKYEHMAYAKYYLKINDLEKAEEHIKLADDLNKVNKEEGYSDFYLYHSINISELNYKRGNINESIQMYENLLEVCESKYNAKKKVLYNLVNIYREIGDYDNSIKYINMLKDTYVEESVMINTNYSDNLVEIRQYEKKMSEIKNKRNRFIIMVAIILVLTFMTVLYFYIKM